MLPTNFKITYQFQSLLPYEGPDGRKHFAKPVVATLIVQGPETRLIEKSNRKERYERKGCGTHISREGKKYDIWPSDPNATANSRGSYSEQPGPFYGLPVRDWTKTTLPGTYRLENGGSARFVGDKHLVQNPNRFNSEYRYSKRKVGGFPQKTEFYFFSGRSETDPRFFKRILRSRSEILSFQRLPDEPFPPAVTEWYRPGYDVEDMRVGSGVFWTYEELRDAARGRPMTPELLLELSKRRDQYFKRIQAQPKPTPKPDLLRPFLTSFAVVFGTGLMILLAHELLKRRRERA
jgi:hypothetical protein